MNKSRNTDRQFRLQQCLILLIDPSFEEERLYVYWKRESLSFTTVFILKLLRFLEVKVRTTRAIGRLDISGSGVNGTCWMGRYAEVVAGPRSITYICLPYAALSPLPRTLLLPDIIGKTKKDPDIIAQSVIDSG